MKTKIFCWVTIFLVALVAISGLATAAITIDEVEFDDDSLGDGSNVIRSIEVGETFTVKVHATSDEDLEDVQIEAYMRGYDHDDRVEDITDVFNMKANVTYVKKLELKFPQRLDQDGYELRVRVEGRSGESAYNTYDLEVEGQSHDMMIKDVIFSPEGSVMAGRALLTSVRLKNYGTKDEESVKVSASIPELGIAASDYVDEVEGDEATTSEELYLRIPSCTRAGTYDVKIQASYDDGDEVISQTKSIMITEDETCGSSVAASSSKPAIIYDATIQDAQKGGQGASYALTITNPTNSAKIVTVAVSGVEVFGESKVSPSNVVVIGAGETKTVFVYVTANKNAQAGKYSFTTSIAGLGASTQDIALGVNVVGNSSASLRTALEVGLVILVVILVIIGLIVGFNKLREDEPEEESQTYY